MKSRMSMLAIPIVLIGLSSCNQTSPATTTDTKGDNNKAVVDKFLTAVRTGDMAAVKAQLADNFMSYGPSIKDSSNTTQYIDLWTKRWADELATVTYNRYGSVAFVADSSDWVGEWGHIDATYKNGTPSISFEYHGAFRMVDGKIAMAAVFYNVADIMEQQGFTFVPPGEKKDEKKK